MNLAFMLGQSVTPMKDRSPQRRRASSTGDLDRVNRGLNQQAEILRLIQSGEATTRHELVECTKVGFTTVDRHLAALRESGLIERRAANQGEKLLRGTGPVVYVAVQNAPNP